jgi:hypothetical protein
MVAEGSASAESKEFEVGAHADFVGLADGCL